MLRICVYDTMCTWNYVLIRESNLLFNNIQYLESLLYHPVYEITPIKMIKNFAEILTLIRTNYSKSNTSETGKWIRFFIEKNHGYI